MNSKSTVDNGKQARRVVRPCQPGNSCSHSITIDCNREKRAGRSTLKIFPRENCLVTCSQRNTIGKSALLKRDTDPALLYPEYTLPVPIDHFQNNSKYEPHTDGTFNLRYWFDATYYKPGGPVIVLQSGETSGEGRLPYLQKGILHQLAEATSGLGVVLEHRYYGKSMPTPDLSTENLRFLTTEQALADEAYFAQHVVFHGLEHLDLTAPHVPYIAYGGSYAGAFVAFLRKVYPDIFWGKSRASLYGISRATNLTGNRCYLIKWCR